MARIRTIKPEFWSDEKMAFMTPLERLVFLGLISLADDAGRLLDNVKQLDGLLFPETEDTCRDALEKLAKFDRIIRYESESGQRLIQVVNWSRHQKVDHPNQYVLPAPPGHNGNGGGPKGSGKRAAHGSRDSREGLANDSRGSRESSAKGSRGSHEDRATSSRYDLRPTTNDLLPKSGATPARARVNKGGELRIVTGEAAAAPLLLHAIDEAPLAVLEFRRVFYPDAPEHRQAEIDSQLLRLANGKAVRRSKGIYVRALSLDRLERKCLEVIDQGAKDRDKAIVILLTKLADTSDVVAQRVRTDRQELQHEAVDRAEQLRDAEAWLASEPPATRSDLEHTVDERMGPQPADEKGKPSKLSFSLRSTWRNTLLLQLHALHRQGEAEASAAGGAP